MQTRRRSRVSRAGCTHAQQSGQCRLQSRILAWRSPPNGDRRCSSHLSHQVRPNVRGTTLTDNSDSQFVCPHRGRKRLSREAILRTELALEWPELVQIGRCKVQWLPRTANKRILTSSCSKKIITQQQRCVGPLRYHCFFVCRLGYGLEKRSCDGRRAPRAPKGARHSKRWRGSRPLHHSR